MNQNLLTSSFQEAARQGDNFVIVFYEKLFEQLPEARTLFSEDMSAQRSKLLLSLTTILNTLNHHTTLVRYLEELGERHHLYRVTPDHYPVVGKALLDTLAHFLGPKWSPELEMAWTEAYNMVATTMLQGYKTTNAGN